MAIAPATSPTLTLFRRNPGVLHHLVDAEALRTLCGCQIEPGRQWTPVANGEASADLLCKACNRALDARQRKAA